VGKTMPCLPAIWEWSVYTTYKFMVMTSWGMVFTWQLDVNYDLQALDVEAKDAWTLFKLMDVSGGAREKTNGNGEIKKEKPMEKPSWCGT
jgi:hypothetical protein